MIEKKRSLLPQTDEVVVERDAWEKMEGEPDLWYDRFTQFRLLGPRRSMAKVYRLSRLREKGVISERDNAPALWNDKAKLWNWRERAAAWDAYTLEQVEERSEKVYNEGLSLVHERVDHLKQLATKLERYLLDPRTTRLSPHLIEQYRGVLDDIAKELNQRVKETRISGPGGGPIPIVTSWGRGGSATDAWNKPVVVEEVQDGESKEISS